MAISLKELRKPDILLNMGFRRVDEATTDCVRGVSYVRDFRDTSTEHILQVRLEFSLHLSDDPFATYAANCEYCYEVGKLFVLQASSSTPSLGWRLSLKSLEEIKALVKILEYSPSPFIPR